MKRTLTFALLILAMSATPSLAQPQRPRPRTTTGAPAGPVNVGPVNSSGDVEMTPEMWFYEQWLRRYNDPKVAVREKAAFRARQRQSRIAAMHWFGQSNSRPIASVTPTTGTYSPVWTGNASQPFWWRGVAGSTPVIVQRPESAPATGGAMGVW